MIIAGLCDLINYARKHDHRINWNKLAALDPKAPCYILNNNFVNPRLHSAITSAGCRLLMKSYWGWAFSQVATANNIVWGIKKNRWSSILERYTGPIRYLLPNGDHHECTLSDWADYTPKPNAQSVSEKLRGSHGREVVGFA